MKDILKLIQGNDELIYTQDEAKELSEMIENVKGFYPRNKEDEKMQSSLLKSIDKLQKSILEYAEVIGNTLLTNDTLSDTKVEKLKKQYQNIVILEKQVNEEYYNMELKYQ